MLKGIDETLHALLGCVEARLIDSGAPVCSVGTTVGSPAIANCCDCGNGEGELWGNLVRAYRVGRVGYTDAQPKRPCAPSEWAAEFQITLARCFPSLDERGELPSIEKRSDAAQTFHADLADLENAINCCTETEPPIIQAVNIEVDPSGGCSYLIATVQVPVSMKRGSNPRLP